MKRQNGLFYIIGLSVALGLCLVPGTVGAQNIAWDMVNSTSQNLVSYSTDAPEFSSPGDGFKIYQVGVSPSIPYALVDDSAAVFPADENGIIDSNSDFHEFFGICDTYNDDNPTSSDYHATWVFDISSAVGEVTLLLDLAAMGEFDVIDSEGVDDRFAWTYQVDAGPVMTVFSASVDETGSQTYTLANGTTQVLDRPLVVNGTTLSNQFQTFATSIAAGSQVTVILEAFTNGGSEGYAARNILVTNYDPAQGGGEPIPTLSWTGIAAMALMLMAGAVVLFRRLR